MATYIDLYIECDRCHNSSPPFGSLLAAIVWCESNNWGIADEGVLALCGGCRRNMTDGAV